MYVGAPWDRSVLSLADQHRHTRVCVERLTTLLVACEAVGRDPAYLAVIRNGLASTREHLDLLTHTLALLQDPPQPRATSAASCSSLRVA